MINQKIKKVRMQNINFFNTKLLNKDRYEYTA